MNRHIILIFYILLNIALSSQTSAISKIKIAKEKGNYNELVGQWVYVFTKSDKGKISYREKIYFDTLDFYPNNKYLQREAGSRATATWRLDNKKKEIILSNQEFTMYYQGLYFNEKPSETINNFGKITKDTITFLYYIETNPPKLYETWYYVRLE
jgi:hypothetical protein